MQKLILAIFLLFGILGFSRYVERCRIVSGNTCVSLESGKRFNFRGYPFSGLGIGDVYRVYFEGSGYRNLYYTGSSYLY